MAKPEKKEVNNCGNRDIDLTKLVVMMIEVGEEKNSIIGRRRVAAVCDGKIRHNSCSSYVQVSSLTSTYQLVEISLLVIFVNVTINTIIAKLSTKKCIVLHMFVMDLSIIIFVVIFTDAVRKWKSGNHLKDLLANKTKLPPLDCNNGKNCTPSPQK